MDRNPAAVIADIVGSRRLPDRSAAQAALEQAIIDVEEAHPVASAPLTATVGDEFQGVYPNLEAALGSLLLLQLRLPDGLALRFGIGIGAIGSFTTAAGELSDGPGWWAARAAIERVHELARRAVPSARSQIVGGQGEDAAMDARIALANAYLLARDELVAGMSERTRRLTFGRCLGRTQGELAEAEGVSQSAVSQALSTAGAGAVVAGFRQLVDGSAA